MPARSPRVPAQEASTLADVYHSLGGLLDSGELGQLLAALGTMRGSMAAVAKVPEFVGVADKVAMLEARIKDLAVADLSGAVSARDSAPRHPRARCARSQTHRQKARSACGTASIARRHTRR